MFIMIITMKKLEHNHNKYGINLERAYGINLEKAYKKAKIRNKIIDTLIEDSDLSIADLHKKLGMNRSTLNHYLKDLEKEGYLKKERIEREEQGRPAILKIDKKRIKKEQIDLAESFMKHTKAVLSSLLTIKIMDKMAKQNNNDFAFLLEAYKEMPEDADKKLSFEYILMFLIESGHLKINLQPTEKGKSYLKDPYKFIKKNYSEIIKI